MKILTPETLGEIAEIIQKTHLGFAVTLFGKPSVPITQEVYEQLVAGGYVSQLDADLFRQAYESGWLAGWRESQNQFTGITQQKFEAHWKDAIESGMPPLGPVELEALQYIKGHAASHIKGLGNRVADDFTTVAIETENGIRKEFEAKIGEAIEETILERKTKRQLASKIGDATGDWARDLRRIAAFELEDAFQHGWGGYYKKTSGPDTRVAKRVDGNACKYCSSLYVGPDGNPKIYLLSELEENGSNVGRKKSEWLPVVGPTHPFCHCTMFRVPKNFGFNDEGQMVPMSAIK